MRNVHPAILPEAATRIGAVRSALALGLLLGISTPAAAALRYALDYAPDSATVQVRLCADAAAVRHFRLHRGGAANIGAITRDAGTLDKIGDARWRAEHWQAGECLHYQARLDALSRRGDRELGSRVGEDLLVAPQQWLLIADGDEDAAVSVTLPSGYALSVPWLRLADAADGTQRYRLPRTPPGWSALVAIGRFDHFTLEKPGGAVHVALLGRTDATQRARLRAWLDQALSAVTTAHGRLPLAQAQVVVLPADGRGRAVVFGQSLRGQGNGVHLWADPARPLSELSADWTAVHEFAHWNHPYLGDDGAWLAEGLASYWQNVLRARAGMLTPQQAWEQLDAGFGRGRAAADETLTLVQLSAAMHEKRAYYPVYWSGAAYWLQVDLALRQASDGRIGIDQALARFRDCCLQQRREWDGADFVAKLDELVGGDVLQQHYRAFVARRGFPPLAATYAQLGLERHDDGRLHLLDAAPAAAIRDAIMRRR